jgi:hypothetical protein
VSSPIWGSWPDIYYYLTIAVWRLWGALSDERTGLSCVYAAGPCQRSLFRVRVPWDSRPYFTVSDLRLPFSSPPTTLRVTVELFDPASTRDCLNSSCPQDNPSARTTKKTHLPILGLLLAVMYLSSRCLEMVFVIPLFYCCATQQPTVYQEPVFAVTRLVSRCPATKCLSCRCLPIHVTV